MRAPPVSCELWYRHHYLREREREAPLLTSGADTVFIVLMNGNYHGTDYNRFGVAEQ